MSNGLYTPINGTIHKNRKMYAVLSGVTRSIKKSYGVVNGINKLMFSGGPEVSFTGTHTISDITIDGTAYKLMTMTGSGTLTVAGEGVKYWMCGSGAGGANANYNDDYSTKRYSGAGGAGGYVASGDLVSGNYTVVIGAGGEANNAGNATSIGTTTADGAASPVDSNTGSYSKSVKGASGGGSGTSWTSANDTDNGEAYAKGSKGSGVSTYPFGESDLKAHSAGGAGGGFAIWSSNAYRSGGDGGTNGSDGGNHGTKYTSSYGGTSDGGTGGENGGGNGGTGYNSSAGKKGSNGVAASFFGSGGGGGGALFGYASYNYSGTGGAGYQGVAYALWEAA